MQYKQNPFLVSKASRLRKNMTKEERHLWYDFLRSYPIRFYRQKVLGRYIVDFCCSKANLIVELDGSQHYAPPEMEADKIRTAFLEQYGFQVIRIPNNAVMQNFTGVCEYIDFCVNKRMYSDKTRPLSQKSEDF